MTHNVAKLKKDQNHDKIDMQKNGIRAKWLFSG